MPSEDFEQRIARELVDHQGPPELAPQLVALARQFQVDAPRLDWNAKLLQWVRFNSQSSGVLLGSSYGHVERRRYHPC